MNVTIDTSKIMTSSLFRLAIVILCQMFILLDFELDII